MRAHVTVLMLDFQVSNIGLIRLKFTFFRTFQIPDAERKTKTSGNECFQCYLITERIICSAPRRKLCTFGPVQQENLLQDSVALP